MDNDHVKCFNLDDKDVDEFKLETYNLRWSGDKIYTQGESSDVPITK